jgi:mono/diheme cytochrome c family protein
MTESKTKNFLTRHKYMTLAAGAMVVAAGGLGFIKSGLYDVSATSGHNPIVAWAMHDIYNHSLQRRAQGIQVPEDLMSAANIRAGAHFFNSNCVYCHGAPGQKLSPIGQGILPLAPDLLKASRRNKPNEVFWVVKNGVKMTGMPAFGKTQSDQTIWQLAAFLNKERGISAQDYTALVNGTTDDKNLSQK